MPKCLALPAVSFNYSLFFINFLHTGTLRKQGSWAVAKSVFRRVGGGGGGGGGGGRIKDFWPEYLRVPLSHSTPVTK